MDDAGGRFAARAAAAITAAPRLEAYAQEDVRAALEQAADKRATLQAAVDEARQAALRPPVPLDVVPRAQAELALQAAEAKLAALRAELAAAQQQLQQAQLAQGTLVPLELPLAAVPKAPVTAAPAAPADAPTVAAPAVASVPAPLPAPLPTPIAAPQVIIAREPFARATGLLQVVTWSIVVAVVLIVLLAWFA